MSFNDGIENYIDENEIVCNTSDGIIKCIPTEKVKILIYLIEKSIIDAFDIDNLR